MGNRQGTSCVSVEAQWSLRSLQRTSRQTQDSGRPAFPKVTASEQVTVPKGTLETMWRGLDLALDVFPILPSFQPSFLNSHWIWASSLGLAGRQMCWGAARAHALIFFGKPTGWHWEHFGLLGGKWLLPSCPLLSITAHPALAKPSLSLSLCPQMGRQDTVLSVWDIPGPCHASWSMALDSAASPSSAAVLPSPLQYIYKPYFYAAWADLDMKPAWFPAVWEYFYSFFFLLSAINYCWWKRCYLNLYKTVLCLCAANIRLPRAHPGVSPHTQGKTFTDSSP